MKFSKRRQKSIDPSSKPDVAQEDQTLLPLKNALQLFLLAQDGMAHSKKTITTYKSVVGKFLRFVNEEREYKSIKEVTEGDILEWLVFLREGTTRTGSAFKSGSIQGYFRDVKAFFSWLTAHGHIEVNPMEHLKLPKADRTLIRLFTEEELRRLDAACGREIKKVRGLTPDERKALAARDRAFLWMLLSTGVRLSEACGLRFSDVDWKEGMIYVRGKGAKERHIPFGKVAQQHLDTYVRYWRGEPLEKVRPDDFVFLNAFGEPLKTGAGYRIFVRLKEVSGIADKRVSPHTCRHWFAVNAIRNGMPTLVLKNILGHERWEMIEIYVRLAQQDLKQSYTRFSPVDALEMHRYPKGKRAQLREWRNSRKLNNPS